MKVLYVKKLNLPDNGNRAPGVVPMPMQTFEADMSDEAQNGARAIDE